MLRPREFLSVVYLCAIVKTCQCNAYLNFNHIRVPRSANNSCKLPQHPNFGKWNIYEETTTSYPGQMAKHRTILQVTCKEKFILEGDATIVCTNGQWTSLIGECLRTCPSRYNSAVMTITCKNSGRKLENCENPTDGTTARFHCADFYEDRSLERNPVHVCFNGKWNNKLPECTPICGQKSINEDPTLIVGGRNVIKGDYPWQVALFNVTSKDLLCGGSLLNQKVILTAAHCITDIDGDLLSKETYVVAVGKYYRQFDHPSDEDFAQFSSIQDMFIPRQYKGDTQNYFGDVAILVTKTIFTLSPRIQPVCVDWDLSRFPIELDPKRITHAYVSGWGYTQQHKSPSNVLKELRVPIIGEQDCRNSIPEDYDRFITDDKVCAGFTSNGTSVCKGDSGGGLVAKHKGRYYIIAVVSLSPKAPTPEGGCDSQQYGLYANVQYHIDRFILEKEARFRPAIGDLNCDEDPNCSAAAPTPLPPLPAPTITTTTTTTTTLRPVPKDSCILPEHPKSGKWAIFGVPASHTPGMSALRGTVLQIHCDMGYKLSGGNLTICENGQWTPKIGQCLQGCSSLRSSETTEVTCSFNDNELDDCSHPVDGTIVKEKCAPFYEDLQSAKNPVRVCRNGSWETSRSECVPICGLKAVPAPTLIINGNTVNKGEYPWQVALYRGKQKQFICGGALIGPKSILTAAHCISNWKGEIQSKENYVVAVGKLYREYYDPLDHEAQFSELQDIFIPLEYGGVPTNLLGDIAVLVSKKPFTLSRRVQPVCVDWGLKYASVLKNQTGYVAGWGFTGPERQPADNLQELAVPIISHEDCFKALPEDFRPFLSPSKICAGYLNRNLSLCAGDTGGALVTKHDGRYYVSGIVSSAPATRGICDSNQYALYTKVADYINFILEKEAKIKASVSSDNDCTNKEDCPTTTPKPIPEPENERANCSLPEHPEFGKWTIFGVPATAYRPKFGVGQGTILQISCYKSYKLDGDAIILCQNGKWSSNMGKCLKTCPSIQSTTNLKATCIFNNKEIDDCSEPTDGTRVKYECAPFYEDKRLAQNPIDVCHEGSWSHPRPQCIPVCGQKSLTPQTLIIHGNSATKSDYPWHVGLYRGPQKEFICSGVLISQQIILTAAQCVTDESGRSRSKEEFTVAAGKYYRKFDDPRDEPRNVQISKLSEIVIHSQYKGVVIASLGSIAMLVTPTRFNLSHTVQPVCVDWGLKYEKELTSSNATGYVTGWGFTTENAKPADELQELEVPIVEKKVCEAELPENFLNHFTYDKFCGGYRNKGKSVCKGDSGGGLVVKVNGRYYITGIIESAPPSSSSPGACDSQQYALYTRVSTYIDGFIMEKSFQFRY